MGLRQAFRALIGKGFSHPFMIGGGLDIFGWKPEENPNVIIKKVKGWSYTCVSRNAAALSQVPLRLYSVTRKGATPSKLKTMPVDPTRQKFLRHKLASSLSGKFDLVEVTDHEVLDLLRVVNPTENGYDLKSMTFSYLEVLGYAYWFLERGAGNKVINIWPLFAQNVRPKRPKFSNVGITHYEYGTGLRKMIIKPEDLVKFKNISLEGPLNASSPTKAAMQAIDLHDLANRFEIASFKNGGKPGLVMSIPADGFIDTPEIKRIEAEFKKKYGGVDKTGTMMTVTGGAEVKEFGFKPKDMGILKGKDVTLSEICGAYGVPLSFVKINDANKASAWGALDLYANYTLNPRLIQNEQKLNEQFTPNFGEDLFLLYDDARPKDREFRLTEIESHLKSKYKSINEERREDGLDDVPWGDSPVPDTQPVETIPEPPEKTVAVIPTIKVVKQTGPKNELPVPDFMPVIFTTQLTILFSEMKAEIIRNLESFGKSVTKDTEADLIGSIFDNAKWDKRLEADMIPFLKGIMVQGVVDSLEKISPEAVFNASSPAVLNALDERKGQIKTIIGTREKEIRQIIKESIEAGESRSQLIKRIRDNFDARKIADTVVRTETIWAHNEGTVEGWKQSGVVRAKQWDTAEDERVCQWCGPMHGKVVGVDEHYFAKGDEFIGREGGKLVLSYDETQHPPLHPSCRCSLLPVLIES